MSPSLVALNGRITPFLSSFILPRKLGEVMLATHGQARKDHVALADQQVVQDLTNRPLALLRSPGQLLRRQATGAGLDTVWRGT